MAEPVLDVDLDLPVGPRRIRARFATHGRRIGLVGPSGAGKTTLLRAIAGVERRAAGRIAFRGTVWREADREVPPEARGVGWVPQEALLFPHLTVRENLGYATAASVADVAAALGLAPLLDRSPRHLSGGERQRVALGRALLASPRLLLLDEPFSALDRALRARVAAFLRAWCDERDVPFVLVAHDTADLVALEAESWEIGEGGLAPLSS